MTRRRLDPVAQRELAQRLRYWIDREDLDNVVTLIAQNPVNSRASHIRHNLGLERLRWLAERGITMNPEDPA